jgi:hypothetical protein
MEALLVLVALGLTAFVGLLAIVWGLPAMLVVVLAKTVDAQAGHP